MKTTFVCQKCQIKYIITSDNPIFKKYKCHDCNSDCIILDNDIADAILILWHKNIPTYSCCQGHKNRKIKPYISFPYDIKILDRLKNLVFLNDYLKPYSHLVAINIIYVEDKFLIHLHSNINFNLTSYLTRLAQEW